MKPSPNFRVAYVPWWRPVRLAFRQPGEKFAFDFVGWVWRQEAYLVKNLHHGWIAFAHDQTPERMKTCPCCGALKQAPDEVVESQKRAAKAGTDGA